MFGVWALPFGKSQWVVIHFHPISMTRYSRNLMPLSMERRPTFPTIFPTSAETLWEYGLSLTVFVASKSSGSLTKDARSRPTYAHLLVGSLLMCLLFKSCLHRIIPFSSNIGTLKWIWWNGQTRLLPELQRAAPCNKHGFYLNIVVQAFSITLLSSIVKLYV